MRAIIPDTLEGALILSVIDFFLSFVIIAGIGVVLSFFPLLNRFAPQCEEDTHNRDLDPQSVTAGTTGSSDIDTNHLVAISAAIHEVMGSHRIVIVESSEKTAIKTQKNS